MITDQNILIVDDDEIILESMCDYLNGEGFVCRGAGTIHEAKDALSFRRFSVVITDMNLPDGDGHELLELVRKNYPQTVVIVITAYGTIESAVKVIKQGAYDYLTKPIVDDELLLAVERATKQQSLMSENEKLRSQLAQKYRLENIVSHDYKIAKIFDLIEAVADSKTTILMTGPSGTGKSMLARAIHHRSSRRDKPFVEVSCGAIPETLLESELFGYAKGAFTGAVGDKEGKFLAANGGTIFLDEISSASPALQVKLLRVLQERQLEAVGSNRTITVDTRVVLASNMDLAEEVRKGNFREDLYYRINVVPINLPPLAERVVDIQLLAGHFMKMYNVQHGRHKTGLTEEATEILEHYNWPGNVRELENCIERAVLLGKDSLIGKDDLPMQIRESRVEEQQEQGEIVSLKLALEIPEKRIIRQALEANHWNRQVTASALDINRTTLFKKMKKYGLYEEAERLGMI